MRFLKAMSTRKTGSLFLTNSFLNMRSGIHAFLPVRKHEVDKEYMSSLITDLKQTAHFDKLNIQSEEEFQHILEILTTFNAQ